jgi:Na+-driven multidrug efflux pump
MAKPAVSQKAAGRTPRLIAIFVLGVVMFNFPLLAVFNSPTMPFGVPILYLYLFGAWLLVIILIYRVVERHERSEGSSKADKERES